MAGCFRKEPSREVKIVSRDLRPPANITFSKCQEDGTWPAALPHSGFSINQKSFEFKKLQTVQRLETNEI
ncbi:hypothetical protein P5673_003414 [Acropora cervicornis]|uniref:Uncharacterized protein n=1 Tax=Acropora cervicornis TaxID=6130 RepID=A0AAD9R2N1_ACRCE|nr:hypothetical protein P5673_003414 [Acropora cervicornis]